MTSNNSNDSAQPYHRTEQQLPGQRPAGEALRSDEESQSLLREWKVPPARAELKGEQQPILRTETELLASPQRYERMANTLPVMLYDSVLGPDGTSRFLYVAPDPCRELLELDPAALLADMSLVWNLIHPEDLDSFQQQDLAANRKGKVFVAEVRIITSSGRLKWLLVNSRPNPAAPGKPVVWSGFLKDITGRKQAEDARFELERKLEQMKKANSLGRMAGAISHNFNNQLQTVIGNLEIAMRKLPPDSNLTANLSGAMKAACRSAEMTRLMLAYLGQTPEHHELLDLAELTRHHLILLRAGLPPGVILQADLPSCGSRIKTNVRQIKQVLSHLVTNAWESFGEDGGTIQLTVKTVSSTDIPPRHCFPLNWQAQDQGYVCLEVADTGCGIAEKEMEQICDPFFSTKFAGRGLGLSVVLGIVRSHIGAVTVQSEPGRGSAFKVFIPAADKALARSPAREKAAAAPQFGVRGTVLLVEDDEIVREVAKVMLTELGFMVLEARDGVEGLEVFRQQRSVISLVFSDLSMPQMGGWEMLAALRQLSPGLPSILASGFDQDQAMAGDHPEQPQAFLSKPYRIADLDETIRQVLKL